MNRKQYRQLCIKAITGNITEPERHLLEIMLAKSDEHRNYYNKLWSMWSSAEPAEIRIPDVITEWQLLDRRIDTIEDEDTVVNKIAYKRSSKFHKIKSQSWKPAFSSMFIIILTAILIIISNRENSLYISMLTANSEHKTVLLPDGSVVNLNSGSRLGYTSLFNEEVRSINLSGEAFFDVMKDSRPFIIITPNAKIKVSGTSFNIHSRREKTIVTVKEGRVYLLQKRSAGKGVNLLPGQQSIVIKSSEPTSPLMVNVEKCTGWMNEELVFEHASLAEIIEELERHYNINISLTEQSKGSLTLSGSFGRLPADSVLEMICLALDLQSEKQNCEYLIK